MFGYKFKMIYCSISKNTKLTHLLFGKIHNFKHYLSEPFLLTSHFVSVIFFYFQIHFHEGQFPTLMLYYIAIHGTECNLKKFIGNITCNLLSFEMPLSASAFTTESQNLDIARKGKEI